MLEICNEMLKLREVLDKKGVIWYDDSDDDSEYTDVIIYRTKFFVAQKDISVIYGHGTVGGCPVFSSATDEKLLEMMVGNGEPDGHLTCDDIVKHLAIDKMKDITEEEIKINKNIKRLVELVKSEDIGEIMEATSCESEYPSYVKWPEDIADELEEICCVLFITTNGGVNWDNINKLRKASNDEIDVVQGDGDSFGWLTGVVCSDDASIMYYCFG